MKKENYWLRKILIELGGTVSGSAGKSSEFWLEQIYNQLVENPVGGGGGGNIESDTYDNRPAASADNENAIFLPTDGLVMSISDGSQWSNYGPIVPVVAPINGDFAWINQGVGTVTDQGWGFTIEAPAAAGTDLRIRKKAAPATPYTIEVGLIFTGHQVNTNLAGVCWRQSSDGKLHGAYVFQENLLSAKYNGPTSFSANYTQADIGDQVRMWYRLVDDGVNREIYWSMDGRDYLLFHQIGRTDFLTADEVGIWIESANGTLGCQVTVFHWKES